MKNAIKEDLKKYITDDFKFVVGVRGLLDAKDEWTWRRLNVMNDDELSSYLAELSFKYTITKVELVGISLILIALSPSHTTNIDVETIELIMDLVHKGI